MTQKVATAEWADPEVFAQKNRFEAGKFWLGRSPVNGQPLGYDDDRHVCLVSGSRSGKGTTTIIPNLCLWPGSVVVVDPKGENATITAARRGPGSEHCEGMGQAVHVLDPFGVARVKDRLRSRFNPLDAIDPKSSRAIDEAGSLADAIVVISPDAKEPFWDESARSLIKTLILHVLTSPLFEGRRNLITVRQLITRGDHVGIEKMKERGVEKHPTGQELLWYGVSKNERHNGVIAGFGQSMRDMLKSSPKQFNSVVQIANRNTEFLDSPDMQRCVEASDFKLSDLKTDPKGISVFLSLPPQYMGEHFRWLRMMVTLTVFEMQSTAQQPACGHRVLVCLDEFAGLERMKIIENAVAQIAGFGVKLFFVLQSLEQLKATYRDGWETFLANSGLAMFYGVGDHFTRDHVSKMIGDTELIRELATSNETESEQSNTVSGTTSSKSWNTQATEGSGSGSTASDNWKSLPLGLRGTAAFISAITGKQSASRSRNTSTNQSQSQSDGGSDSQQQSSSEGRGRATASGHNESLHKRPLITPDEVGRFFGRIDDKDDPVYPGLGLTVHVNGTPSPVQRVNYFEDRAFDNKFDQHPDHPDTDLLERRISRLKIPQYDPSIVTDPKISEILTLHQSTAPRATYSQIQTVEAPIKVVWKILLNTERYDRWMAGFGSYGSIGNTYSSRSRIDRMSHLDPYNSSPSFAALGDCVPYQKLDFHRGASSITISLKETASGIQIEYTKNYWKRKQGILTRIISFFTNPAFQKFVEGETQRESSRLAHEINWMYETLQDGTYDDWFK